MQDANLTQDRIKFFLTYDPEAGTLRWNESRGRVKRGSIAGTKDSQGRLIIKMDGYVYKAHRLIWFYMTGAWPKDQIDHRDGNQLNNAWSNLREASSRLNQQNKRRAYSNSKTGLLGACFDKKSKKYVARINSNGKRLFVGLYNTAEEAHAAYVEAKRKLHEGNTL